RRRRPGVVRLRSARHVPARRRLRRPHPQGRETGRSAGAGADQVRVGDQHEDRQGARPDGAGRGARPRRRGDRVRRRQYLTRLGGAGAAWPLAVSGQQAGKLPTIGFLGGATPSTQGQGVATFVQRLRELGWVEGRTVAIEYRWAEGRTERFAEIAAELARL